MPTRSSMYYNNPGVGQAFENIGQMFAPPSAQSVFEMQRARALQEDTARKEILFGYAGNPEYDQTKADRLGVAAGLYNPDQSYYSVDTARDTARRGQDSVAATLRANNTADNTRAISTNEADNVRAVETNAADNRQKAFGVRYGDIAQGAVRPAMGPDVAAAQGLPASPAIEGNIDVNQGAINYGADGKLRAGAAPSVTREQVIGAALRDNIAKNPQDAQIPDDVLKQAIIGGVTPDVKTNIVKNPTSGKDEYATTGASVGMEPGTADKGAREVKTANYAGATPDGKRYGGKAYFDEAARQWIDTSTRQPIPADASTYQGQVNASDVTGLNKGTENTVKLGMFAVRGAQANDELNGMEDTGYRPGIAGYELTSGIGSDKLPLGVSNTLAGVVDPKSQKFAQAGQNFLNSIVRPDSGSAFSVQEKTDYARTFLPLPGDLPDTITAKRAARNLAIAVVGAGSSGQVDAMVQRIQKMGLPVSPSLLSHFRLDQPDASTAEPATQVQNPAAPGAPVGTAKAVPVPAPAGGVPQDTGAGKSDASPLPVPAAAVPAPAPVPAAPVDPTQALNDARAAIAKGAPRDLVIKRLTDNGISPRGL